MGIAFTFHGFQLTVEDYAGLDTVAGGETLRGALAQDGTKAGLTTTAASETLTAGADGWAGTWWGQPEDLSFIDHSM